MCAIFGILIGSAFIWTAFQWGFPDGVGAIFTGIFIMWFAWDLRPGQDYRIDSSVKNKIVAHDGNGRYLVEAKTSRQITGPRPHITGNLPASLSEVKKGLWVVNNNGFENDYSQTKWQSVDGNYHIEPRGNTQTGSFLRDIMEGYEHNYVVKDDE